MENSGKRERFDYQLPDALVDAGGGNPTLEYRVGRRTRELREERGWSQADLGRRLAAHGFDMHQTTVAKLENYARPIRHNEVGALAEIFGVSIAELDGTAGVEETDQEIKLRDARRTAALLFEAQGMVWKLEAEAQVIAVQLDHARMKVAELEAELGEVDNG